MTRELRHSNEQAARLERAIEFQKSIFIEEEQKLHNFIIALFVDDSTPQNIKEKINENFHEILPNEED